MLLLFPPAAHANAGETRRSWLLQRCRSSDFPDPQFEDGHEQGVPLAAEARHLVRRLFGQCGITALDIDQADGALVINTWYALTRCVGEHLLDRDTAKFDVYDVKARLWTVTYRRYLEALWNADPAQAAAIARELGIEAGIPKRHVRFYRPRGH